MPTLAEHFHATGNRLLDERQQRYAAIDTPEKVLALQRELRALAREVFGEYTLSLASSDAPPKVLKSGKLECDGVVIEKFLYEALPDFWVSALLYRPARDMGRCPALVMPVGHWFAGKSQAGYQQLMRVLARRGVVCASFDGCGHGERVPWFHPVIRDAMSHLADIHPPGEAKPYPLGEAACHGFWAANNVTSAHALIGDPGYLCGVHQHALTAVAGKRLVDLLVSRKNIAAEKIGACGASGGGADTRFLSALDERIALAVPTSIVGSDRSLSGGDADQSFFFTVSRRISQTDLLICLAPNPLLIISSSEDKHDTAKVAAFYRPFWSAFGKGENIASATGHGAHGFPHESREIIAAFVLKHFRGETPSIPDAEHIDDLPMFSEEQLRTTLSGNVFLDGLGKSPFDLIRDRALDLAKRRPPLAGEGLRRAVIETIREGDASLQRKPGNVRVDGNAIVWEGEGNVPLRVRCEAGENTTLLIAHENGGDAALKSPLYSAARQTGAAVGLVDVRGTGLSATPGEEYNGAFLAPLLMGKQASLARLVLHQNRTLTGLRVADLLQTARVLKDAEAAPLLKSAQTHVDLVAEGGLGLAALIAAFLAPDAFRRVILYRTPVSWCELAVGAGRLYSFAHFLYGVLERFDTPDLTRALPDGKLLWINATDASGKALPNRAVLKAHSGSHAVFKFARSESDLARFLQD